MSVLRARYFTEAEIERFWKLVDIVWDGDACWLWKGFTHRDGHGQFKLRGKVEYAHRVAYALVHGCTPYKRLLCHTCDTPGCCNPDHLYVGDKSTNAFDYWRAKQASVALREHYAKKEA
jgi:hypothetical protein